MSKVKKISALVLVLCVIIAAFSACSASPQKKLIGSWRDSTGLVGYDFAEDNKCKIVYADTVLLGRKITANIDGAYKLEKRDDGKYYVTITYTFFATSFNEDYQITIDGSTLSMINVENQATKTLIKSDSAAVTNNAGGNTVGELTSANA